MSTLSSPFSIMVTTHIATCHSNILLHYCYDLPLDVLLANNFHDIKSGLRNLCHFVHRGIKACMVEILDIRLSTFSPCYTDQLQLLSLIHRQWHSGPSCLTLNCGWRSNNVLLSCINLMLLSNIVCHLLHQCLTLSLTILLRTTHSGFLV